MGSILSRRKAGKIRTKTSFMNLFQPLVVFDAAVADGDDAVGAGGDVGFVGDDDDGVAFFVKAFEQMHYLDTGF